MTERDNLLLRLKTDLEPNLYNVLIGCVVKYSPSSYLEIGVQEGHSLSTVLTADVSKNITRLALCDNWGGDFGGTGRGNSSHIQGLLRSVNYDGAVSIHDGDSRVTVPNITDKFSMILVDGDHSADGCLTDMENSWKLLEEYGVMIVDDIVHPAHRYLMDVVSYFISFNSDEIQSADYYVDKPNGAVVIKKKGSCRE